MVEIGVDSRTGGEVVDGPDQTATDVTSVEDSHAVCTGVDLGVLVDGPAQTVTDVTTVESSDEVSTGVDLADSDDDFEVSGWGIDVVGGARGEEDVSRVRVLEDSEVGMAGWEDVVGACGIEEVAELSMCEDF